MTSRTSIPRWIVLASTMAIALNALASSSVIAQESPAASPAGGAACAEGAATVDFWTEHTPPDSDGLQAAVDAFQSAPLDPPRSSFGRLSYSVLELAVDAWTRRLLRKPAWRNGYA